MISRIPGVRFVSLSSASLISGSVSATPDVHLPGESDRHSSVAINWIGPEFFRTMGISLIYGRSFDVRDANQSRHVAVISQSLAKQFFLGVNPLGRTLQGGRDLMEVVGISRDTKFGTLRESPLPTVYLDYAQYHDAPAMTCEVKTAIKPDDIIPALRNVVTSIDRDLPLLDIRTQNEQISASLGQEKTFSALTAGFSLMALVLASIGIYGISAYNIVRRTNEIGIRFALGAQRHQVLAMFLREGLLLAMAGIVLGIVVTLPLTRLVTAMLYGVSPTDPLTLTATALILLAVALLAAFIPARGASPIEPTVALRHQ